MGDPSHVAHQPYDAGSSKSDGVSTRLRIHGSRLTCLQIFPRHYPAGCDPIQAKTISFCDHEDVFCDSGDDLKVHMAYVTKYGAAAADFVVSMINMV